jgi:hypothetical protein
VACCSIIRAFCARSCMTAFPSPTDHGDLITDSRNGSVRRKCFKRSPSLNDSSRTYTARQQPQHQSQYRSKSRDWPSPRRQARSYSSPSGIPGIPGAWSDLPCSNGLSGTLRFAWDLLAKREAGICVVVQSTYLSPPIPRRKK